MLEPASVRQALGLSRERMGRVLDVSAKTVERWEGHGGSVPDPVRRAALERVQAVIDLARTVYGDDGFRAFLTTPQRRFDGRSPQRLLESGDVDRLLGALAGDYEGLGH